MMFGSDNNSLSKKIQAQQQKKVRKWGRGAGPIPAMDDQEYLEDLARQAKEKRKQQEEEAKREKEEIFEHYKNYSLGTSERSKDLWNEEDEAELYKEPTHTAVNNIREDLFGGKPNEAQESYSFNRHRPRRLEQLNNKIIIEEDGMTQLAGKLSQGSGSSQPKGKREEVYEKKRMMRMMKKNGEAGLFEDDTVSPIISNSAQKQSLFGSEPRSKSTPKNISKRDLVYEQKRQAMREKNLIIQRRQPQEITNDPESDYENEQMKYAGNNKPNHAKPTWKKNQEITHDPESDYENEQEKYHFQEVHMDPKRLSRNGGFSSQSQPPSTVVTPSNDIPKSKRSSSINNSRDYNFASKGGNIFDKMGSNDPPIPRRRGLNRLYNDYPPSPNNNNLVSQHVTPFQQLPPSTQNSVQTPRSFNDDNYHRSVSNNSSRHQTAVQSPENDFYIGSSSNSAFSSSPVSHTRKQVFKSELYGRDDASRKLQQQSEYRMQLMQQMEQRGKQNNKKKEYQEEALLPSQKSQEEGPRSPSSKFSNQHFHQLESNLPFGAMKPISPNKPPSSITNVGMTDASKSKLQKQLEYQEELKKQLSAKKAAEEERKRKDEEMDRKIEENIRRQAELDRIQVEKERREKEAKNNPPIAVGDVKSNQIAVPEPIKDVKNDLFGNPSEIRRNRRQKEAIIIEDSSPPPENPMETRNIVQPPIQNIPPPNSGLFPNIFQTPQVPQMPQLTQMGQMNLLNQFSPEIMLQLQLQQIQQQQMVKDLNNQIDKNVITYLLTQLYQQQNPSIIPPQQPIPSPNVSINPQEANRPEPVNNRSRSLSNPVKSVDIEQKEESVDDRPIRRKPKLEPEENSDHEHEAIFPKKESEAPPIRRRRKKPSLEDELNEPKPSKSNRDDEGPPSASKKSKRVFKIGAQKNADEENNEEREVAAQPTIPKPVPRSRRVFSVGKGNNNHESSPIHTQPLSDEEYRNLDSD